ncbi:hypothetical protein ABIA30_004920 [Mycobacterium sp. MAA66]|uniref:DUF5134 domain-containing protein n=1 Tax=Mycobacterium sp. MAA66 TaxID=3156297 RepID=UPI0035129D5A
MIYQSVLRWALTVVFAAAAVLFVGTGYRTGRRSVWTLHALASVAMIAMAWPVGMQISPVLYALVFTACALYFAWLSLYDSGLPHPVYHVTMMAAMAAMGLLMAPNTAIPAAGAQAVGHHSHATHAASGTAAHLTNPGWLTAVCVALAAGFGAATLWWFYLLARGPARPYGDVLMALGMSVSFAAMAA